MAHPRPSGGDSRNRLAPFSWMSSQRAERPRWSRRHMRVSRDMENLGRNTWRIKSAVAFVAPLPLQASIRVAEKAPAHQVPPDVYLRSDDGGQSDETALRPRPGMSSVIVTVRVHRHSVPDVIPREDDRGRVSRPRHPTGQLRDGCETHGVVLIET